MNITPVVELSTSEAISAIQIFDHLHSAREIKRSLPMWDNEVKTMPCLTPVIVKMLPNGRLTVTVGK
jgi:hypothetical protein